MNTAKQLMKAFGLHQSTTLERSNAELYEALGNSVVYEEIERNKRMRRHRETLQQHMIDHAIRMTAAGREGGGLVDAHRHLRDHEALQEIRGYAVSMFGHGPMDYHSLTNISAEIIAWARERVRIRALPEEIPDRIQVGINVSDRILNINLGPRRVR